MYRWVDSLGRRLNRRDSGEHGTGSPFAADLPGQRMLMSDQQLREHARELTVRYALTEQAGRGGDLGLDEAVLDRAFQLASAATASGRTLEPAAEWLIDNFYVIKEQIKEFRTGLPRSYRRELPVVVMPDATRVPRVLMLMRELVAHADGRIVIPVVRDFVEAYQEGARLTLGELWAIPLMLRLALMEQLRPLGAAITLRLSDTAAADEWANRLLAVVRANPTDLIHSIAEMARSRTVLSPAWVTEFHRRMQGGNPALTLALVWLEQQMVAHHLTIPEALEIESRAQAAAQVSIGNCIGSLRLIGRTDWTEMAEALSSVEAVLRGDPAQVYGLMDFPTRDRYRHAVEFLARRASLAEWDVAARAVARAALVEPNDARARHVGYWLIGRGRDAFSRDVNVRLPLTDRMEKLLLRYPSWLYVGPIVLLTLAIALLGIPAVEDFGRPHALVIIAALIVAASHLSVAVVNWMVTREVPPQPLSRLALKEGIPDDLRTLVAVPCLLTSEAEVAELLAALEIRYLANRDANLYFALLSDFTDAPAATMPQDAPLLAAALAGIQALNATHEPDGPARFCLFHRDRSWNEREGVWMGRERKRGKLVELNRFLRGQKMADFHLLVGEAPILQRVKFVIALDADTQLPPQSASRLVATLAHPLNRPRLDHKGHRIVEGYGVLQPRVSVGASRESASALARLHSDEIALDPYTRVVSDVYQDLYAEASFIGKGIYDVDAFLRATGARFPDNLILSHDLLEGSYARTGLVSDVELFEHHPDRYSTEMRRRHRWTRGDWQILHWLLPWVPGPRGHWVRNTLTSHHRWKLLDNLRRSLVPAALLVLLLNGWLLSSRPIYWSAIVIAVVFASPLLISLEHFLSRNPRMEWQLHFRLNWEAMVRRLQQTALLLVMLPFEAMHYLDAIAHSLWRVLVTRRRLLQWTPASEAARGAERGIGGFYRLMWTAPVLSAVVAFLLPRGWEPATVVAAPLLLLWVASPLLAWALSRPVHRAPEGQLSSAQRIWLGVIARRTWHFFETFTGPDDHALPPDNFQEYPSARTAHRTSPTNIGMYMVSVLSAWDFGYLAETELHARLGATLDTLDKLSRYRGHFLNWYDTRTLEPLPPAYVSSVDTGNLLGCLLVLARGLDALDEERLLPPQVWRGLRDTWRVFLETSKAAATSRRPGWMAAAGDLAAVEAVLHDIPAPGASLHDQAQALDTLAQHVDRLTDILDALPFDDAGSGTGVDAGPPDAAGGADGRERDGDGEEDADSEMRSWLQRFQGQCDAWQQELGARTPWHAAAANAHVNEEVAGLLERLDRNPSLRRAAVLAGAAVSALADAEAPEARALRAALATLPALWRERVRTASALAKRCRALSDVDFAFLCEPGQRLLAIGYNVDQQKRDASVYDLLASEARLASFVAIAQGKLPREHWFALGRLLTIAGGRPALASWSGSMFEYLMPLLLMPSFENTLLTRTCRNIIARQISYGRERGIPWGISESAYNITDAHFTYQYRAFGVPGLGLKRGLAEDLVVAPYASALALLLRPDAACRNLRELARIGASGRYGFYESLDFTPARVPADARFAVVRAFMAHHQGMTFTALSAALNDSPLQRRFLREPMFRANQLLLQEKIPAALSIDSATLRAEEKLAAPRETPAAARVLTRMDSTVPQVQLLSNGRYHVVVSQAGGGFSQWGELAVSHWREDPTRDAYGIFCYVQDLERNLTWSNTWQPTVAPASEYAATFVQASAEFRRRDHDIETHTRIAVSSEDDIELRRITVSNRSSSRRRLALTSYVELVMTPRSDAAAHPAFNKLFVETEFVAAHQAILARRRARSADEDPATFLHLMGVRESVLQPISYETRRDVFIGRGGSTVAPLALANRGPLANGAGAVLDPIAALRREFVLEPGESQTVDIVTGAAARRETALALAERYADRHLGTRVFDLAWTREQVIRHQLDLAVGDLHLFARLASSVLYPDGDARARGPSAVVPNVGQSGLWRYGISGDLPILLVRVGSMAEVPLVRQVLQAHMYWQVHGLPVDLVIWNEDPSGYRQELHDRIMGLIASGAESPTLDRPGGVFVRRSEHVGPDDRVLLMSTARIVLNGRHGTLAEQLPRRAVRRARPRPAPSQALGPPPAGARTLSAPLELQLFNGTGGYSADGREYIIWLPSGQTTPLPWSNVLANPRFGTVVSEAGGAYTWSRNAREFRLTTWYNDPVTDDSGEAFYIRDDATGAFWSPTPLPARGGAPYLTRHGFGYSRFETVQADIASSMTVFVATERALKFSVLKLRNEASSPRTLSVFGYVEWVLGDQRSRGAPHVSTSPDPESHAIYARNSFNDAFSAVVGLFAVSAIGTSAPATGAGAASASGPSATASRTEFIGRNGGLHHPRAMRQPHLGRAFGTGIDPCAAWQVPITLAAGEERELVFVLGVGADGAEARRLVREYASPNAAAAELAAVHEQWRELLGRIVVSTPDPATNLLLNGWLTYQVIACRLWARSGYYQSGGAFGFRDQLQDAISLLPLDPTPAREQILLCAAHQFIEGDVQHWWHPPHGRGVRTHFSDDYLWLPWAVAQYVEATGDAAILDVSVPFLEGRALRADEESYYDFVETSAASASLYEHCTRAMMRGLRFGAHGLPLIGAGDWNDGMNRVGRLGRGESVWLGFFLIDVLRRFVPLAIFRGDQDLRARCIVEADALAARIEVGAWDGDWYRRAYTDDGAPLGSALNDECQIDSLPQSWSVLAEAGSTERHRVAMDSAIARLVHPHEKVIQLFDPPFDKSELDPGYIKGYIPGTRENGGQYTHAAIWLGMAAAKMGRSELAWQLFEMINPINHARNAAAVRVYKVEPYVVAADVYWASGHRGRGGWTWYTGSAGWLYRFGLQSLLGLHVRGDVLTIAPCIPDEWPGYRIAYRHGATVYDIEVVREGQDEGEGRNVARARGSVVVSLDGERADAAGVPLDGNGGRHAIRLSFAASEKESIDV